MFNLKNNQNKLLLCFIYILVFLYLTTDNLSLNDLIYSANQTDIISFYEIAKKSPEFPVQNDIVAKHDAQRFLIPYLIGLTSYLGNFDLFNTFKVINFLFIFLMIFVVLFLSNKLKLEFKSSLLFFSLFYFNPYTIRYGIFNPIQVHDILFFITGYLIGYGIIFEKKKIIFLFSIFSLFLRQTAIAYIINILLFYIVKNKKFGKINLFLYFVSIIISFFIIIKVGNVMSTSNFPISNAYNILFYDFTKVEELLRFLALPLVSFFPILITLFAKKNKFKLINVIIIFFICMMMISQPILGGPENSGRNVVRIASLCYPILLVGIFYLFNFSSLLKNNFIFYGLIIFFHLWSLHPTFSVTNFFDFLRF